MNYLKKLKIRLVKGEYKNPVKGQVRMPEQVYDVFKDIKDRAKETLIGVYLDDDLEVRSYDVLSLGNENSTLFDDIEILEHAILLKSKYFIIIHNHPSGNPTPSYEDEILIKNLIKKSKVMRRVLVDFIIVGDMDINDHKKNYWSIFEYQEGGEYTIKGLSELNISSVQILAGKKRRV